MPPHSATTDAVIIGSDDVHVWCLTPSVTADPATQAAYWDLLSADERARHDRLRVATGREQYLAGHALLRLTLSRYAAAAPQQWRFVTNRYGRPEIAGPAGVPPLRFNLSHTRGLVACAVTLQRDIGIDVEEVRDKPRHVDIAQRFFAPQETAALIAVPTEQQVTRFFEYWTLKESYIKARGMGLSLPLRRFAFDLSRAPLVSVSFEPELSDDPTNWEFSLMQPTAEHVLAVAARRNGSDRLQIRIR